MKSWTALQDTGEPWLRLRGLNTQSEYNCGKLSRWQQQREDSLLNMGQVMSRQEPAARWDLFVQIVLFCYITLLWYKASRQWEGDGGYMPVLFFPLDVCAGLYGGRHSGGVDVVLASLFSGSEKYPLVFLQFCQRLWQVHTPNKSPAVCCAPS